jgi:DNA ligase-1
MLAATVCDSDDNTDLEKAFRPSRYGDSITPLYLSPKYDGIRVLCHPTKGPVTRSLKPVNNEFIRWILGHSAGKYLDGEILVGEPTAADVFSITQSAVMTHHPFDYITSFTYVAFDSFIMPDDLYALRLQSAKRFVDQLRDEIEVRGYSNYVNVIAINSPWVTTVDEVLEYEEKCLSMGYEGIMIRRSFDRYKYGRSTLKELYLGKIKRMTDAEGEIIGVIELMHNNNKQELNNFGLAKRATNQENLVPGGTLGALKVRVLTGPFEGCEVDIGSGFDSSTRSKFWLSDMIGRVVTFKYQQHGSKDAPRFPIFKGLRHD